MKLVIVTTCMYSEIPGGEVSIIHITGWKQNALLPDSNHVYVFRDPRGCRCNVLLVIHLTGWNLNVFLPESAHVVRDCCQKFMGVQRTLPT